MPNLHRSGTSAMKLTPVPRGRSTIPGRVPWTWMGGRFHSVVKFYPAAAASPPLLNIIAYAREATTRGVVNIDGRPVGGVSSPGGLHAPDRPAHRVAHRVEKRHPGPWKCKTSSPPRKRNLSSRCCISLRAVGIPTPSPGSCPRQRQRAALIRTMTTDPQILLLDEASSRPGL